MANQPPARGGWSSRLEFWWYGEVVVWKVGSGARDKRGWICFPLAAAAELPSLYPVGELAHTLFLTQLKERAGGKKKKEKSKRNNIVRMWE